MLGVDGSVYVCENKRGRRYLRDRLRCATATGRRDRRMVWSWVTPYDLRSIDTPASVSPAGHGLHTNLFPPDGRTNRQRVCHAEREAQLVAGGQMNLDVWRGQPHELLQDVPAALDRQIQRANIGRR